MAVPIPRPRCAGCVTPHRKTRRDSDPVEPRVDHDRGRQRSVGQGQRQRVRGDRAVRVRQLVAGDLLGHDLLAGVGHARVLLEPDVGGDVVEGERAPGRAGQGRDGIGERGHGAILPDRPGAEWRGAGRAAARVSAAARPTRRYSHHEHPAADPLPDLLADARAALPATVDLRRRLHRTPEVGLHLPETQAIVRRGAPRARPGAAARHDHDVGDRGDRGRPARARRSCCGPTWTPSRCTEDTGLAFASADDRRDARLRARHAHGDAARRRAPARRPPRRSSPGACC